MGLELLRQIMRQAQSEPKTFSKCHPPNGTYRTYRTYLGGAALTLAPDQSEILNLKFLIPLHHTAIVDRRVRVRHQQTKPWIRFWREEQLRVDLFVKFVYV